MVTAGVATFSTTRWSRCIHAIGVLSAGSAIFFSRQRGRSWLSCSNRVSQAGLRRDFRVEQLHEPLRLRPLGFPRNKPKNEIVAREERVDDLVPRCLHSREQPGKSARLVRGAQQNWRRISFLHGNRSGWRASYSGMLAQFADGARALFLVLRSPPDSVVLADIMPHSARGNRHRSLK